MDLASQSLSTWPYQHGMKAYLQLSFLSAQYCDTITTILVFLQDTLKAAKSSGGGGGGGDASSSPNAGSVPVVRHQRSSSLHVPKQKPAPAAPSSPAAAMTGAGDGGEAGGEETPVLRRSGSLRDNRRPIKLPSKAADLFQKLQVRLSKDKANQ